MRLALLRGVALAVPLAFCSVAGAQGEGDRPLQEEAPPQAGAPVEEPPREGLDGRADPAPWTGAWLKRNSGRGVLTFSLVGTIVGPWMADFNETHFFNDTWRSHARFHTASGLVFSAAISAVGLWALWRSDDPVVARVVAAAVPILYWGSFFVAYALPGTSVDDPEHLLPRPLGIPLNLLVAGAIVAVTGTGYALDRAFRF